MLGLDLLDLLVLVVACYPVGMLVHALVGLAAAVALGVCLRLLKWGKLPEHTLNLVVYSFVVPEHTAVIGEDDAPLYPRARGGAHGRRAQAV